MRSFRRHKDQPQPSTTALVLLVLTISLLKPFSASALHFDNPCFMFPDGFDTHKHLAHQENASENGRLNGIRDRATYSSKVHFRDKDTGDVADCVTQYTASSDSQQENPLGNESALLPNRAYGLPIYATSCEDDDRQCEVSILSMTMVKDLREIVVVVFTVPLTGTTLLHPRGHLARPDSDCVAVNINHHNNTWRIVVLFIGARLNLRANVQWTIKRDLFGRLSSRITYDPRTKCLGVGWRDADGNSSNEIYRHYCANSSGAYMPEMVGVCAIAPHGSAPEYRFAQIWELSSVSPLPGESPGSPLPGECPVSPLQVEKATDSWLKWLLIVMGGVVVLVAIIVAWANYRSKVARAPTTPGRGGGEGNDSRISTEESENRGGSRKFIYRELEEATNSFASDLKLGQGASGTVYKGHIGEDREPVAVKIITSVGNRQMAEFIAEMITMTQLSHTNLVKLKGYCHELNGLVNPPVCKLALVYEFIGGGTLSDRLFKPEYLLTWEIRYNIALGLASALHYLRKKRPLCVIHRDIKSSNVLLDEALGAKLGDFGTAKLVDHTEEPNPSLLAGTPGYWPPEYVRMGVLTKESDIYSFGVVLLEIVCGRKAVFSQGEGQEPQNLVEWVWLQYESGNLLDAVDSRLNGNFDEEQAEALTRAGLWCAHPDPSLRPSIEEAETYLNLTAVPPELPSKIPPFGY